MTDDILYEVQEHTVKEHLGGDYEQRDSMTLNEQIEIYHKVKHISELI